jgi:hypothetical protein
MYTVHWQDILQTIPVNANKELTSITFECIVQQDGILGYFDMLSVRESLANARLNGSNIVYLPIAGGIDTSTIAFAAIAQNNLDALHFISSADIECTVDNNIVLSICVASTGAVLATKTLQTVISKNTVNDFGPVDSTQAALPAGTVLLLKITHSGGLALPPGLLVVEWSLG